MSTVPTVAEAGDRYARWVHRTGLSENTAVVYEQRIRSFLAWMTAAGDQYDGALTDEHVRDYASRDYRRILMTVQKRAPATVAQHMSALGSFYEWLGLGKPNGIAVEVPPSPRTGLDEADLRKVLRACERRGPRDYAIGQLLFQSAVRVDELVRLDVDDVLLTDRTGMLEVRYGKGGKARQVPLSAQVRDVLRAWLADRATWPGAGTAPLFLSRRGDRLSTRTVQDTLAKAGQSVDVHVTPHTLRHTFARRALDGGTDIVTLQEVLGHKNINTTRGYAKPTPQHKEHAVEAVRIDL